MKRSRPRNKTPSQTITPTHQEDSPDKYQIQPHKKIKLRNIAQQQCEPTIQEQRRNSPEKYSPLDQQEAEVEVCLQQVPQIKSLRQLAEEQLAYQPKEEQTVQYLTLDKPKQEKATSLEPLPLESSILGSFSSQPELPHQTNINENQSSPHIETEVQNKKRIWTTKQGRLNLTNNISISLRRLIKHRDQGLSQTQLLQEVLKHYLPSQQHEIASNLQDYLQSNS